MTFGFICICQSASFGDMLKLKVFVLPANPSIAPVTFRKEAHLKERAKKHAYEMVFGGKSFYIMIRFFRYTGF